MAIFPLLSLACLLASLTPLMEAKYMNCGPGVPLCGVLALESGFGKGYYRHKQPVVHGLWPQVGNYGSSRCIAPKMNSRVTRTYQCYVPAGNRVLWFEQHEWDNHGRCAGVKNTQDFFNQVCRLSEKALAIMSAQERGGFNAMIASMRRNGAPIYSIDYYNDQIELSACAGYDGLWKIVPVANFQRACGGHRSTAEFLETPIFAVASACAIGMTSLALLVSLFFRYYRSSRATSEYALLAA